MNTISRSIVIGGALVMVLVGCQKQDESVVSRVQPSVTVTGNSAPVAPTSTPDRSVPEVTGKGAATQDTTALQQKAEGVVGRVPFLLLLNKADLNAEWQIDDRALWKLAERGWPVLKTSAKTGAGVDDAFTKLARQMADA